jgi:hypothetical protein
MWPDAALLAVFASMQRIAVTTADLIAWGT